MGGALKKTIMSEFNRRFTLFICQKIQQHGTTKTATLQQQNNVIISLKKKNDSEN